jgi:hypothetical protein
VQEKVIEGGEPVRDAHDLRRRESRDGELRELVHRKALALKAEQSQRQRQEQNARSESGGRNAEGSEPQSPTARLTNREANPALSGGASTGPGSTMRQPVPQVAARPCTTWKSIRSKGVAA